MLSAKSEEELAMNEREPDIIALVENQEARNLAILSQAPFNGKVLQSIIMAVQQGTTLPQQF